MIRHTAAAPHPLRRAAVAVSVAALCEAFVPSPLPAPPLRLAAATALTTVAGGGLGDGGAAVDAILNTPSYLALDPAGDLLVADGGHRRVRRITSTGGISTVAGSGVDAALNNSGSSSGDGGAATLADMVSPAGVAVGGDGTMVIADSRGGVVRAVDRHGVITTLVGGACAAGASGTPGRIVTGGAPGQIVAALQNGKPAAQTCLGNPLGLAYDTQGDLFIADYTDGVVKVTPDDHASIVAGGPACPGLTASCGDGGPATGASLSPSGVAVDASGTLYISSTCAIRMVNPQGVISTIAGSDTCGYSGDGGPAVAAELNVPSQLALHGHELYVADTRNNRIRRIDLQSHVITTVAGSGLIGQSGDGGAAVLARLAGPTGVAVEAGGAIDITDTGNHRVRHVDTRGMITTMAGTGVCCAVADSVPTPATRGSLIDPYGLTVGRDGSLYIADTDGDRVHRVTPDGMTTTLVGTHPHDFIAGCAPPLDGQPSTRANVCQPHGMAVDAAGNVYIADYGDNVVRRIDAATHVITTVAGTGAPGFSGDGGPATSAQLYEPWDVVIGPDNALYISDNQNNRVRMVSHGVITTVAGCGRYTDACPSLFTDGATITDGSSATAAPIGSPTGLAVDAAGNLFIAVAGDGRVYEVHSGTIAVVAGGVDGSTAGAVSGSPVENTVGVGDGGAATSASLSDPDALAFDARGDLFIAEGTGGRVRMVDTHGVITTVAGNGTAGYCGDTSGPCLNSPNGVAVRGDLLYISDSYNGRVRGIPLEAVHGSAIVLPSHHPLAERRIRSF